MIGRYIMNLKNRSKPNAISSKPLFSTLSKFALSTLATFGLASNVAHADSQSQVHYPLESQDSFTGPTDLFTGNVKVKMLFPKNQTADYSGAYVSFDASARTAWHQHPAGQHMIVTQGTALTGTRDGKIISFKKGETVWCPKDIDHWHGATEDAPMTHLVITGDLNGENVVWKEKVSDQQYLKYKAIDKANLAKPQTEDNQQIISADINALTKAQQAIVPIAAFTANGDLNALKKALENGLESGLTINQIKEVQMHLYAYVGFPRTLNGLATFMKVLESRQQKGIDDKQGASATALSETYDSLKQGKKTQTELVGKPVEGPLFDFAPYSNKLLQRHLFGDLFARDILDYKEREITTIAALANIEGVAPQLQAHMSIGSNSGLTRAQLKAINKVLQQRVSTKAAYASNDALEQFLSN